MRKLILFSALFSSPFLMGEQLPPAPSQKDSNFHAIVASGYAWSMEANIRSVDYSFWSSALDGYDSDLGSSPYIMLGFGYRFLNCCEVDFGYTLYGTFHYQKNQTDPLENKRTRFFDLDHQSALFNFTYFPYAFDLCKVELSPFIGGGLGVGINQVSDFETVYYNPTLGMGITTSIGSPHTRNSFAWQGTGGLRIHPMRSKLSLDIAYRYYNGGTFETPSLVTDYNGLDRGYTEKGKPWRGTLQTNQLYFSINFAI